MTKAYRNMVPILADGSFGVEWFSGGGEGCGCGERARRGRVVGTAAEEVRAQADELILRAAVLQAVRVVPQRRTARRGARDRPLALTARAARAGPDVCFLRSAGGPTLARFVDIHLTETRRGTLRHQD
ncbi:hypothetical protein [Streptomyces griseoruber]|uniref:hypothetical protein n=1 Tax=Streptomyces griseoruber TaxID=1943 RepID=UPI000ABEA111|nr:hypothetical protein [Streptomyces griseoruber]